jgi:hypothetical protein
MATDLQPGAPIARMFPADSSTVSRLRGRVPWFGAAVSPHSNNRMDLSAQVGELQFGLVGEVACDCHACGGSGRRCVSNM